MPVAYPNDVAMPVADHNNVSMPVADPNGVLVADLNDGVVSEERNEIHQSRDHGYYANSNLNASQVGTPAPKQEQSFSSVPSIALQKL